MLGSRDLESSNPAGEGRAKSRAAASIPQVLVSWFREGKVLTCSCLPFAAPRTVLPKKKRVFSPGASAWLRDTEAECVPGCSRGARWQI